MSTVISDNNTNDKRELCDLEWCEELYQYLQNKEIDKEAGIPNKSGIELSPEKAFKVILFLQEHLRVIPDNIERCQCCDDLYDTDCSGLHIEEPFQGMNFFCDSCMERVPENHE